MLLVLVIFFNICLYFGKLCICHISQTQLIAAIILVLMRLLLKFVLNVAATGQRATAVDWLRRSFAARELNLFTFCVVDTVVAVFELNMKLVAVRHPTISCSVIAGLHRVLLMTF